MNTSYFEEMTANCTAYERAKKERTERKQQIAESYGWDSPEMDAWYAEEKAAGLYPYTSGEMKAYWVFKNRRENDGDEFEMTDYCWDTEYHDFIETLRKLGVTEITVTNHSTGLMDDIYGYTAEGCTMVGRIPSPRRACTGARKNTKRLRTSFQGELIQSITRDGAYRPYTKHNI